MIRALWIDDEADTETMASRRELLYDLRIDIKTCSDVRKARELIASGSLDFDVILVDMIMPPLDVYTLGETSHGTTTGLRVIEEIRVVAPDVPIIVVSARRLGKLNYPVEDLKIADYIEKPVRAVELASVIRRALAR